MFKSHRSETGRVFSIKKMHRKKELGIMLSLKFKTVIQIISLSVEVEFYKPGKNSA